MRTPPNSLEEAISTILEELEWVTEEDAKEFSLWSSVGSTQSPVRLTLAHIRQLQAERSKQ
ncbi:MAG: hypothetical protein Pyrs2KO_20990 [Pyruvatibacter sp.]